LIPPFIAELPQATNGEIAAFDADGTLWTNDVADDFTQWMISEGNISGDSWDEYMRIYADDPPTGCRYLLTLYRGKTIAAIGERVTHYWEKLANRTWIDDVVQSLLLLKEKGYSIWIVSGTPTLFLLPLAEILGTDKIIGMDFETEDRNGEVGLVTGEPLGIPCAGEGKALKLKGLIGSRDISICCGNGSLDGPMMEMASKAWSIYPNAEFETYSRQQGYAVLPRPADFEEEEKFLLREEGEA
jgi:HAD superfamily phosphoserine phosphatase-like hydrolase